MPDPRGRRRRFRLGLLTLCLLAFALRLQGLGRVPLNGDEAFSVLLAQDAPGRILATLRATEPHPPLYYLSLHAWLRLAGPSELAARFPSAAVGTLAIPALGLLFGRLGLATGLVAALLAAVSPFMIRVSQDVRMYAYMASFNLLALVAVRPAWLGRRRSLAGYGLASLLALLSHYYSALAHGAQILYGVLIHRRMPARRWLAVEAAVLLVWLAWLVPVLPGLLGHRKDWLQTTGLAGMLGSLASTLFLGEASRVLPPLGPLLLALAAVGLVRIARRRTDDALALLLYLVLPLLGVYLASLARPAYHPRYLAFQAPILLGLAGAALLPLSAQGRARRLASLGGLLALVLLLTLSTLATWTRPELAKAPDYPRLAEYLGTRLRPGDVVVQNYPDPALAYYLGPQVPRLVLPGRADVPAGTAAGEALAALRPFERAWFLPQPDPAWDAEGAVWAALQNSAVRREQAAVGPFALELYDLPAEPIPSPETIRLGELATWRGWQVRALDASRAVEVRLDWEVLAAADRDYTLFVHLVGPDGAVWAQHDAFPLGGLLTTSAWRRGTAFSERVLLPLPPQAPPGSYHVQAGLYFWQTLERLPLYRQDRLLQGGSARLGSVETAAP